MRGNRSLGVALLQGGLISNEDLEAANHFFLSALKDGKGTDSSLLKSLLYDVKALSEQELIEYQISQSGLNYIPLNNYHIRPTWLTEDLLELALATRTLPIDLVEDTIFFASAYNLSTPVVQTWEEQFKGQPLWFVSKLEDLENTVYRLKEELVPEPVSA